MASDEGFEGYHVPQQSRRDKLRVVVAQNQQPHESLLPFYDSSFITSFSNQQVLKPNSCSSSNSMKDLECSNFMMRFSREEGKRVMNNSNNNNNNNNNNNSNINNNISPSPSSSNHNHPYYESLNHGSSNNPFFYQAQNIQNLRNFDQVQNSSGTSSTMMLNHEPLSLSLSSNKSVGIGDNNLPLELNLQRYGSVIYGGGGVIQGLVDGGGGGGGSVPFTGYASVLKDSRFLKPAQELLEEMCDVGGRNNVCGEKVVVMADSSLMMESPLERLSEEEDPFGDGRNKSRLLTMLDEVYKRYRQYYQQMQSVVTSFEYVSGLNNAAPYASLAIKAMSKHFRCLKKAITDQLQSNNKAHFHSSNRRDESPRFGNNERGGPYSHRTGYLEQQQPVWRPQRGLPERAVTVLRAWLFEHFLHPYPTDTDKIMLAKQTGLSRSQVSNWFINARVRLWKPMVEEIHMLETRQAAPKDSQQKEENSRNNKSNDQQHHLPSDTSLHSENPSTSTSKFPDSSSYKRVVNEIPNIPSRTQGQQHQQHQQPPPQQMNLPFQQVDVGVNMGSGSNNNNSNSNVSLTLGLYQNHGIGLAEPFPLSAAQRFGLGLETNNEGNYVMSGFESQNRHFGGHMFHDFVG